MTCTAEPCRGLEPDPPILLQKSPSRTCNRLSLDNVAPSKTLKSGAEPAASSESGNSAFSYFKAGPPVVYTRQANEPCRDQRCEFVGIGLYTALTPHARFEKRPGIVISLGLDILAQAQRHRAAGGGVGQHRHRARQHVDDLLGPRDPVEQTRDGAETVVRTHRRIAEILDLLEHRIGTAADLGRPVSRSVP